ncbi:uncharacterized protein VTP21DRAFT_3932 [Calcarisporiella thermophila]|uniref:uncharacterized protein n=1 Tax=Calcarisporiella thermophila TaxID=911321 RepID=UPI0037442639
MPPSFLSRVMEAFAPQTRSHHEALREAWTSLRRIYEEAAAEKRALGAEHVNTTPIPQLLETIVRIVSEEALETDMATGPCLEYMLEHSILEDLVTFAKLDLPKGMRVAVLRAHSQLISNVHTHLLPEVGVRVPLQKLIAICHGDPSDNANRLPELKMELIRLIHTIFKRLMSNAALIELFFQPQTPIPIEINNIKGEKNTVSAESQFHLFSILFTYMNMLGSPGRMAREAILYGLRLMDIHSKMLDFILNPSDLCNIIAIRLSFIFNLLIPTFSNQISITDQILLTAHPSAYEAARRATNKRAASMVALFGRKLLETSVVVEEFFKFWEFVNEISATGYKELNNYLIERLISQFLPWISAGIQSDSDDTAVITTEYLTDMIRMLSDPSLLKAILFTLFSKMERRGERSDKKQASNWLREILIDRIESPNDRLCIANLRLLGAILDTYDQYALHHLVFREFETEHLEGLKESPRDLQEIRDLIERALEIIPCAEEVIQKQEASTTEIPKSNNQNAGSTLLANEENIHYESYINDAQERHQFAMLACARWTRPFEPVNSATTRCKGTDTSLLRALFRQTEFMMTNSLERNLALTSVLSKLAGLPDSRIDILIFGAKATDNITKQQRCLLDILRKISHKCQVEASSVEYFETRVAFARRKGFTTSSIVSASNSMSSSPNPSEKIASPDSNSPSPIHIVSPSLSSPNSTFHEKILTSLPSPSSIHSLSRREDDLEVLRKAKVTWITNFCNAYVVLQEFCKELAAIVLVKYMSPLIANAQLVNITSSTSISNTSPNSEHKFSEADGCDALRSLKLEDSENEDEDEDEAVANAIRESKCQSQAKIQYTDDDGKTLSRRLSLKRLSFDASLLRASHASITSIPWASQLTSFLEDIRHENTVEKDTGNIESADKQSSSHEMDPMLLGIF